MKRRGTTRALAAAALLLWPIPFGWWVSTGTSLRTENLATTGGGALMLLAVIAVLLWGTRRWTLDGWALTVMSVAILGFFLTLTYVIGWPQAARPWQLSTVRAMVVYAVYVVLLAMAWSVWRGRRERAAAGLPPEPRTRGQTAISLGLLAVVAAMTVVFAVGVWTATNREAPGWDWRWTAATSVVTFVAGFVLVRWGRHRRAKREDTSGIIGT